MSKHTCAARNCDVVVPPSRLMCGRHWRMVPPGLQAAVWRHYRPGQGRDRRPSREYLRAMMAAIRSMS